MKILAMKARNLIIISFCFQRGAKKMRLTLERYFLPALSLSKCPICPVFLGSKMRKCLEDKKLMFVHHQKVDKH